jgi:hypothetical protein
VERKLGAFRDGEISVFVTGRDSRACEAMGKFPMYQTVQNVEICKFLVQGFIKTNER